MYQQIGNTDAARSAYRQAILVDPWLIGTTTNKMNIGQILDVDELADEIERSDTRSDFSWRGWRALREGRIDDANKHFTSAILANPRSVDAYSGLALVYLKSNDLSNAERMAKLALLINTFSPRAHLAAGRISHEIGDEAQAMGHFLQMFHLISARNKSSGYYENTYSKSYLPFDLVPQLRQSIISEEMLEDLERLVEYLEELGEEDDAREIMNWLNNQIK